MKVETLIAGAGLAGLSCARELYNASHPYLLVEKEEEIGGLCRTILDRGFTFDYTGHFLHFQKREMKEWVLEHLDSRWKPRPRHAAIFSQGTYSEYPYQENNAGLPSQSVRENVLGYLEALLQRKFKGVNPDLAPNFKRWCLQALGEGISKRFMFPYNEKLWKIPLLKLTTRWMGRFVPSPRILEVLKGALDRRRSPSGYNATFLYPDHGGISILPKAIGRGLPNIWRGVGLQRLDLRRREAVLTSGLKVQYRQMISSLPLPKLAAVASGLPLPLTRSARELKATSIYSINLGIRGPQPIPYSWIYFPEREFLFHRAGSVSACVPSVAPKGHASLYVEFSYRGKKPDSKQLGRHALSRLKALGWLKSEEQIVTRVDLDLPGAYVIYDEKRNKTVPGLLSFLRENRIFSIGRYGRWEYGSMESAMEQGIEAAREILKSSV